MMAAPFTKILGNLVMVAVLALSTGPAMAEVTLVHAGRLLAVPDKPVQTEKTIVIRGGRVEAIRDGYVTDTKGETATVVDLKDHFVMPGFIDGHVHLTNELGPRRKLTVVERSDPDVAMISIRYAKRTLMAGFTSVRDMGAGGGDAIFALRDAIAAGDIVGPRVFAAGQAMSPTGGHGDTHGFRSEILALFESAGVCDGAADCRRAVRSQVKRTADHIKLTATGGVLSETAAGTEQQFFMDELKAIMDTAHLMGRRVAAHAHGATGINAALRAGVDSIEHGTYANEESFRLFKETGAFLVPTISAGATVADMARPDTTFMPPPIRAKALAVGPQIQSMVKEAHAAGVKIAFGTDCGVCAHGSNAREFLLLVEAGLTPREAIVTATINGAANMGMSEDLGTLEPGKYADLVAVDGDPLADVNELLDVDAIMKDGVLVKAPS